MGVYIPTWRKPDDCLGCPFHQSYEDGTISCELPESSPDDCKMVDVKAPHGRLIDENVAIGTMQFVNEAELQIYGVHSWRFATKCICALQDAPTVIEQEDE